MRVYFEKPRTTIGWKGLINDPDMNDSFNIEKGLRIGRKLLLELNEKGLPCAMKHLTQLSTVLSRLNFCLRLVHVQPKAKLTAKCLLGLSSPVGFKKWYRRRFNCCNQCHAVC